MRRSAEQEKIVTTTSKRFTVTAAAGSGKTSVLVDRYVHHVVDHGYSPDEILTVTFTRKAAAEMKKRIVERLRRLNRIDDAQIAETGPIQTIHSFCERVLRENALLAEVDPEFEILHGAQAQSLVEEAVTRSFLDAKDESPMASSFLSRYAGKGSFKASASVHGRLKEAVHKIVNQLRSSGLSRDVLMQVYATPESTVEFWTASALSPYQSELTGIDRQQEQWGKELADTIRSQGGTPPAWIKTQSSSADRLAAEDTCGLVWLALNAWDWLEAEMAHIQQFDFALLESKAVHLMENSEEACAKLRRQFRMALVDEAQDLNPLQYRILDQLHAQAEMMVGDPHQSIYRGIL